MSGTTSVFSPADCWSAIQWKNIAASAQTERRGGAGPVRGLLGGKASPAAFVLIVQPTVTNRRLASAFQTVTSAYLSSRIHMPSRSSPLASGYCEGGRETLRV